MMMMIRAELYRLFRTVIVYGSFAIIAIVNIVNAIVVKAARSSPGVSYPTPDLLGQFDIFCIPAALAIVSCMLTVGFMAEEREHGYLKNLVSMPHGRRRCALVPFVMAALIGLFCTVVGVVSCLGSSLLCGLSFTGTDILVVVRWFVELEVVLVALTAIPLLVLALTRSKALAVVTAFFVPTGLLRMILEGLFANVEWLQPFAGYVQILPSAIAYVLNDGVAPDWYILRLSVLLLVGMVAATIVVCERQEVR